MRKAILLVTLLLVTAGCAPRGTAEIPFTEITYHLTGGIAGFDRLMHLGADGSYRIVEPGLPERSGILAAADLRVVKRMIAQVDWRAIKGEYLNPRVADSLNEALTITTKTITYATVVGTDSGAPQPLIDLLAELGRLMAAHRD